MQVKKLNKIRIRRSSRTRARIRGTSERPRLSVFRSNMHISAQLIDDVAGRTLAQASSLKSGGGKGEKSDYALRVGTLLAERAALKGIKKAVFDRGRYKFHGRVKALCDGARRAGLQI